MPKPEADRDDTSATSLLNALVENFVSNDLAKLEKLKEELLGRDNDIFDDLFFWGGGLVFSVVIVRQACMTITFSF